MQKPLRIHWDHLDQVFDSCLFKGKAIAQWNKKVPSSTCESGASRCEGARSKINSCKSTGIMFENTDRGCLPGGICSAAASYYPNTVNAANLYGCGLRALFETTEKFDEYQIPFHDGVNGVRSMSLQEAKEIMSNYYVIGIHFRIGDNAAFFRAGNFHISPENHVYLVPFKCAATIQSHLENRPISTKEHIIKDIKYRRSPQDIEFNVNGKPVRWFLASDSNSVRQMAIELFGDKLFMITTRPTHIAFSRSSSVLEDTFAEWLLLGSSDSLVVNRIGGANLFRGRLSSFSKTAWVYNLKNLFYDAGSCRRRQIILDGTWKVSPHECQKQYSFHHRLSQPHLLPLPNSSFPEYWMDNGKITTLNEKYNGNTEDNLDEFAGEEDENSG